MAAHNELGILGEQLAIDFLIKERIRNSGKELAFSKGGGRYYSAKGIASGHCRGQNQIHALFWRPSGIH